MLMIVLQLRGQMTYTDVISLLQLEKIGWTRPYYPKSCRSKHFGHSGRTKWPHLVNEDTADWNNLRGPFYFHLRNAKIHWHFKKITAAQILEIYAQWSGLYTRARARTHTHIYIY